MSFALISLSVIILALAVVPFVSPRMIFEYPFVVGIFLAVWLLPQVWAVEAHGLSGAFDPTETWLYMSLCLIFLVAGYMIGRTTGKQRATRQQDKLEGMYNEKRMTQASVVLIAVGAVSFVMMNRMAATYDYSGGWTGAIVLYGLLATCLVFGASLTFLIYLRTKSKSALLLFLIATAIYLPILVVSVKREFIFDFAVIVIGGVFLVKKFVPPRAFLIFACVVGAFIVNKAGDIRGYVKNNDSTLIGALTDEALLTGQYTTKNGAEAAEVTGCVTDIAIASERGIYHPFVSLYNGMVSRYFPALIFGRDAKNSMMIQTEQYDPLSNRAQSNGATRTGFSDTFLDYWYFGVLAFAFLGWIFGWLYSFALVGGLREQYFFIALLGSGLHAITHGFQEFAANLPFMFLIVWLPFRYARVRRAESEKLKLIAQPQGG